MKGQIYCKAIKRETKYISEIERVERELEQKQQCNASYYRWFDSLDDCDINM